MKQTFTAMLSAAGRRVALLRLLRQSIEEAGFTPRILSTDVMRKSAAFHLGDICRLVPRYREPKCLEFLLEMCRELEVKLVVPTIDPELPFYAAHRERFAAIGTTVLISSPEAVEICNDKQSTHDWLTQNDLPTVQQADAAAAIRKELNWTFPLFVKPRGGSASIGARIVNDLGELRIATAGGDFIVQQIAPGQEYTVDLFIDRTGHCRCAVPRMRNQTRSGEVSKGMTVRCQPVEELAKKIAESLPGAWGVINTQIFYDAATGAINVIELNPRFGGGYPLSHQAGAQMARWVAEEVAGLPSTAHNEWTDGLVMLRYDEAVFVSRAEADDTPGPVWPGDMSAK
jgi:carbamoyl-phosphate synthase large subunit